MSEILMRIVVPISLVLLLADVSEAITWPGGVNAVVTNALSNNKILGLHCYERLGQDLGEKQLPPGGEFKTYFIPRLIFNSSKYSCSVIWAGSNLQWFDLWSKGRDWGEGPNIKWNVTDKEACRFENRTGKYSLCVPYNQGNNGFNIVTFIE
ncbi:hypothetical protein RYX36_004841 [Vicia faba]